MLGTIAEELKGKKKIVLVHGNADMDAIGSAYAIVSCIPDGVICAPGGIDRVSKNACERLDISVIESYNPSEYDLTVVVDTSSPEQLNLDSELPTDTIIIDHHTPTGKWDGFRYYYDESRTSCCEIIYDLLIAADAKINRDAALALMSGMLTDSGRFQFADSRLLRVFSELMDRFGIDMDEAYAVTENEISISERIATLKAIERTKFDRVGTLIVATSYGGSFEASSCKAIIAAGADVVFVGSQRDDEFRISARATQDSVRRGVNMGEILKDIGQETVSDGGGHPGAAGLSGRGDVEALLHICMLRTMDIFRDIKNREAVLKS